jgi:hypothetical protein
VCASGCATAIAAAFILAAALAPIVWNGSPAGASAVGYVGGAGFVRSRVGEPPATVLYADGSAETLAPMANPGFETGDFTSWVTADVALPTMAVDVVPSGYNPGFGFFSAAPTEGTWAAMHGFDGQGPGTIVIAQDLTLSNGFVNLDFDYRAAWDNTYGATQDRVFRVDVEPMGGGAPILSEVVLVAPAGTTNPDTGSVHHTINLTALAGSDVRVSFEWYVPEAFTGPGEFQLDNVTATSPLPYDFAMLPEMSDSHAEPGTYAKHNLAIENTGLNNDTYDLAAPTTFDGKNWTKQGMVLNYGTEYDIYHASAPSVLKDGSTYKMWYQGDCATGDPTRILYATSPDGIAWTKQGVAVDVGATYDTVRAWCPCVIKVGGEYRMWYSGYDGTNMRILYANSTDGVVWVKRGLALNIGGVGESLHLSYPCVIVDQDGSYKMWYSGYQTVYQIFLATSPDGLTWTKQGLVLPYNTFPAYEADNVHSCWVVKSGSKYCMWYTGKNSVTRILYATSTDGIAWTKMGLAVNYGDYTQESDSVGNPCVILDGVVAKMWYSGADWSPSNRAVIMYATRSYWTSGALWPVTFRNSADTADIDQIAVTAGESKSFIARVLVPSGTARGSSDAATVIATSQNSTSRNDTGEIWTQVPVLSGWTDGFEAAGGLWRASSLSEAAPATGWEVGAPVGGPGIGNSSSRCAGTNIDDFYYGDADACLTSPYIKMQSGGTELVNQTFLGTYPPSGWSEDDATGNWNQVTTAMAGGASPEARFTWTSSTSTWRLKCGPLDTSGLSGLTLRWRNYYDDYPATGLTVKVQMAASAGGPWADTGWFIASGGGNVGPGIQTTDMSWYTSSSTFYFAFVVTGNAYNLDSWHVDDVVLSCDAPTGVLAMTFWHWYDTAAGDGGFVELGTDSGGWTHIEPTTGYTATGGTLGGYAVDGYGGDGTAWDREVYNLSAYADQVIRLRFHFASSALASGHWGWYVDDVFVGLYVPIKAFSLTPMYSYISAPPDGVASHCFTVTNLGEVSDTYVLSPGGNTWPTDVVNETGAIIGWLGPVQPGDHALFFVRVSVPHAAANNSVDDTDTIVSSTIGAGAWWTRATTTCVYDDFKGPEISNAIPPDGSATEDTTPTISVDVTDPAGVVLGTVRLYVQGYAVMFSSVAIPGGYRLTYTHEVGFALGTTVSCKVRAADEFGYWSNNTWSFTVNSIVSFSVPVHAGWNLMSLPFAQADPSMPQALMDTTGDTVWDRVVRFDPVDRADPWKQYNSAWPPAMNDLTSVGVKGGFWLHVTAVGDGLLDLSGAPPASTAIALRAGWNLVGYPTANATVTVSTAFAGTGADAVEVYDAAEPYLTRVASAAYVMKPGEGYWVHVPTDAMWVVDW